MKKLLWCAMLCALFCLLPLSVSASESGEQEYYQMVMKMYTGSWYHQSTYTYTYDRYGNLIQEGLGGYSTLRNCTTYEYTYNPDGSVRKMLTYKDDEYQSGTLYEYNEAGFLIRTLDWDTGRTLTVYVRDEYGNAIRQENYDSDGKLSTYYESTYDGDVQLSRKICRKDGYVMSSMEYDPATGISTQTSATSKTVTKYNVGKIMRSESYQNGSLKSYTVYTYYGDYMMIATSYDGIGTRTGYVKQEFDSNGNITLNASYNPHDEAMLYQTYAYTYPNHTHSWKVTESTESTCSGEGYKKYKCIKCNQTYTEAVPTALHTYDDLWCDTDCNVCGAVREAEHLYNNDCDITCNDCGYRRATEEHQYTNDCDPTCNICGEAREVEHSYQLSNSSSQHWQECEVCGAKQTKEAHTYEHACDPTCEVCGYVRSEISLIHSYTNKVWEKDEDQHWRGCLNCGEPQAGMKYAHKYDSDCDADCNTCGYLRAVTHTYETEWSSDGNAHWHGCTVCGRKQNESAHTYDDACDAICNDCNYIRTVTHTYSTTWRWDILSHWHECMDCGFETDVSAHQPGAAATEATPQTCTVCGYVIEAALGHTHRYETEWSKDGGQHWHECDCGAKKDGASHNWDSGKVTKEPTTSFEGERTYTCTVCKVTRTEAVDRLPPVTTTSPVTTPPTPVTTPEVSGEVTDAPPTTTPPVTVTPEVSTRPTPTEKAPETSALTYREDTPANDDETDDSLRIVTMVLAVCLAGAVVVIIWLARKKK